MLHPLVSLGPLNCARAGGNLDEIHQALPRYRKRGLFSATSAIEEQVRQVLESSDATVQRYCAASA